MITNENEILELLPLRINSSEEILNIVNNGKLKSNHITLIKSLIGANTAIVCSWLKINVKTYRKFAASNIDLDPVLQKRIILFLILIKHGIEFFGTGIKFKNWLLAPNFYFDYEKPLNLLNNKEGIQFIDNILTNMEYGNNA
jgi:uncharacterized protein (DUF2384 family)